MKIDLDYLKNLLLCFQKANGPYTDISELRKNGIVHKDDILIFHMDLLCDKELIKSRLPGKGYLSRGAKGDISLNDVPLRLTAAGHEFIDGLNNKDIWGKIKKKFLDVSINTLLMVAKEGMTEYVKREI